MFSNVTWGTGFSSPTVKGPATGNPFDWDAARAAYLQALTLPAPTDREAALVGTFEALGHVMHLVQDLAVPAHVRNDFQSHFDYCDPRLESFARWCENSFERFVLLRRELVDDTPPIPIEFNGNRLTRFWDLDRYTGTNPSTDTIQGLAEYTNANFASQNTMFTEAAPGGDPHGFPFPRETSTDLPELIAQRKEVRQVTAEDGVLDTGLYVKKIADGEVIDHFLKAGYLTDFATSNLFLRPSLRLTFQMDDVVLGDYAAKLLPRALGYSTGLLDYFFRGKLDVDVIEADPADPSRLQLVGMNGSPEALKDGSLTVYADDPSGLRSSVTSAGVSQVEPTAALPTLTFQAPEDSERFVAVFQGTLGQEAKDPARNLPGAVIGKVLGGVRVEEVFSDGLRWHLRTPQGVFPLPISAEEIEGLRWGDRDNTLVGRTEFGPGDPNQLVAYEIARTVGSTEVPLVSSPDGSQVVDLKVLKQVAFPLGMELQTTVNLTHTIQYRQYLLSFAHTTIFTPADDCPTGSCVYRESERTVSEGQIALLSSESRTLTRSVPLILAHDAPLEWDVREIALTATGRILALVEVEELKVTQETTFEAFTLTATGGDDGNIQPVRTPIEPVTERFSEPIELDPLVWVLVDVERGQVVASSAPGTVTISHTTASVDFESALAGFGGARMFLKERFDGGDQNGTFRYVTQPIPWNDLFAITCPEGEQGLSPLAEASTLGGTVEASISQYRPELEHVHFPSPLREVKFTGLLSFLCPSRNDVSASFRLTQTLRFQTPSLMNRVRRAGVGAGEEQLVILVAQEHPGNDPTKTSFGEQARLVVWRPERATAEVRQEFQAPAFYSLAGVSSGAALVEAFDLTSFSVSTILARLEAPSSSVLFPGVRLSNFLLLDPDFLYNTSDLKFYRKQPPLQRTALPAKLAPLSSGFNPVGAYHVLRLQ